MENPALNISEKQKQQLMATTLQDGLNAWDYVLSKAEADQPWVAKGILSCIGKGYSLNRLTINWEARELRYNATTRPLEEEEDDGIPMTEASRNTPEYDYGDILPYLEGLPSRPVMPGGLRQAIRKESDRLIAVAREVGQFISFPEWDTFGIRTKKLSGESIVFYDEQNSRVVKFKDPFAYIAIKGDNPYSILYEHHIHNRFFGEAPYRFLGMSKDPFSGGVRMVFEQPFIETLERPTKTEIHRWFAGRGFYPTPDGFWFTDGDISFTDVWADNCLKDPSGRLIFIDPIIKQQKPI